MLFIIHVVHYCNACCNPKSMCCVHTWHAKVLADVSRNACTMFECLAIVHTILPCLFGFHVCDNAPTMLPAVQNDYLLVLHTLRMITCLCCAR